MLLRLEKLGRLEMDHRTSGLDGTEVTEGCIIPFLNDAQSDPNGFFADLRAIVAGDAGGFATFGASRLVFELLLQPDRDIPDALALVDAAIAFKRARGLPWIRASGYESARWAQTHPGEPW